MKYLSRLAKVTFLLSITCVLLIGQAPPDRASPSQEAPPLYQGEQPGLVDQLHQLTGGKLRVSTHSMTGKVRFIGTDFSHAIPQPAILGDKPTSEAAARGFLSSYGPLFGLKDQGRELTVMRSKTADRGRSFVRFQQVYSGIPIVGGELIVQVDSSNNVISANGEILPDIHVDTSPRVSPAKAEGKALAFVIKKYGRKYDLERASLMVSTPELWIYNPILLGVNRDFTHLVWRMDVTSRDMLPIRELVLIDAHIGSVVLHFNQIDTALYREVYDHNNTQGKPFPGDSLDLCRAEGDPPSLIPDCNDAYDYSGDTYDFYWNEHGRDSLDNAGMNLISTTRACPAGFPCPMENAYWEGSQMVYGDGYASADDVVGHEMTHGVTEHESHLFYYMQSGAINESFSDIWGEFVDLTNLAGDDTAAVRWLLGEDLPIGAIRDMEDPTFYGDPDRMGSDLYVCGDIFIDNGGVHFNSGVANKAAYLMTDGGSFNGYIVTGLGISNVADLFYEVQTNLFTSAGDYQDLYDALIQAAINLGFSSSDRQEVQDVVDATEMNQQPTSCPATEAPVCDIGVYATLFFDDLENPGSGYWTHGAIEGVDEWYYPQIPNPYGFDATYATSGQYNFWGYNQGGWPIPIDPADIYMVMTFDVSLPAGSAPYMHFNHSYEFENGNDFYDGGVVEYSTDGGFNWFDAGPLFIDNGYTGTINTGFGNPLGGRDAFVSFSSGYISSRLDLSSLAGQNVRFRFRIGTDDIIDMIGWFIDDVHIYVCITPQVPDPPTNLVAAVILPTQVDLSWTDNSNNEDGFRIERKQGLAGTYGEIGTVGANVTTYSDMTTIGGPTYYYRVRAYNASGDSNPSNEIGVTTGVPDSPSGLSANAVSYSRIDLTWTDNSVGETGFKIQRKTGAAGVWTQIAVVGADETSYADTSCAGSTTYYYRVFSYNTMGDSVASNEASATTPEAPVEPAGDDGGGCSMSNPEGQINIGHQVILVGIFALGLLVWREMRRRLSPYGR